MLTNWQYVVDVLIKIRINRKYVLKMIYCSIKLQLTQFNDTLKVDYFHSGIILMIQIFLWNLIGKSKRKFLIKTFDIKQISNYLQKLDKWMHLWAFFSVLDKKLIILSMHSAVVVFTLSRKENNFLLRKKVW